MKKPKWTPSNYLKPIECLEYDRLRKQKLDESSQANWERFVELSKKIIQGFIKGNRRTK